MCKFRSGIIFKDKIIIVQGDNDSHTTLLRNLNIEDSTVNAMTLFVRAELLPPDEQWWTDPETWRFHVDQDILPDWFTEDKGKYEAMFRETVKAWWEKHVLVNEEVEELSDGFYMVKDCRITKLSGDAYIWRMYDSQIEIMFEDSQVGEMLNNSQVEVMYGYSRVGKMYDRSQIEAMHDHSQVNEMHDHSRVDEMYDHSRVNEMHDHSRVDGMHICSRISTMFDDSHVGRMNGNSQIDVINDNSHIETMYSNSMVCRMLDSSQIDAMYDNSMVCKIFGNNKTGEMHGNSVAIRQSGNEIQVYTACKDRVALV